MEKIKLITGLSMLALASGCATGQYDPNVYQGSQANMIGGYQSGVVTAVRDVAIQDDPTGFGAVSGAVIGGLIGSQVGGGSGQYIGATIGTTAGGVVGNSVENNTTAKTEAQEITVRLSNGANIVIVQGNSQNIQSGERVKLMSHNGHFRIVK
jgi:outer membrane lipoprotein SlyB